MVAVSRPGKLLANAPIGNPSQSRIAFSFSRHVSPSFKISSGTIAVGNPLGEFAQCESDTPKPGAFRLAPHALKRLEENADEGAFVDGNLVYAWDAVFTSPLAKALRELREHCGEDASALEQRHWQLERRVGTKVGCYRVRYVCDQAPPGRYQLQPYNVVRTSAWRFGIREAAGKIGFHRIIWKFSISVLAAGLLCLMGLIFAIAAIGCVVQHFVDPDVVWNRDPVRGVIQPLGWACMSAAAITAGICLYCRKYLWAIGMMMLIGALVTVLTSWYGV